MNTKKIFTEHEITILKALWKAKKPLTRPQILEYIANQGMNPSSFHFAMNGLIEKGYVEVSGFERCGANYGRTYAAKKTRGDFVLNMLWDTRPDICDEEGVTEFMAAFVQRAQIDKKTICELENLLAKRRKELEEAEQDMESEMEE